jgi:hypothetical protein
MHAKPICRRLKSIAFAARACGRLTGNNKATSSPQWHDDKQFDERPSVHCMAELAERRLAPQTDGSDD